MKATIILKYFKMYPFEDIFKRGSVSEHYWKTLGRFMSPEEFRVEIPDIPVTLKDGAVWPEVRPLPLYSPYCVNRGGLYLGVEMKVGPNSGIYITYGRNVKTGKVEGHYETAEEYDASNLWCPRTSVETWVPEKDTYTQVSKVFRLEDHAGDLKLEVPGFCWEVFPDTNECGTYGILSRTFRTRFRGEEAIGKLIIKE